MLETKTYVIDEAHVSERARTNFVHASRRTGTFRDVRSEGGISFHCNILFLPFFCG